MLPDTLQNLPRDERYAYARLLAYMARVDEEITVDELAMFEQQLGKALLSPNQREVLRRSLKNPPTLEECLDGLGPEAGRLALRLAGRVRGPQARVEVGLGLGQLDRLGPRERAVFGRARAVAAEEPDAAVVRKVAQGLDARLRPAGLEAHWAGTELEKPAPRCDRLLERHHERVSWEPQQPREDVLLVAAQHLHAQGGALHHDHVRHRLRADDVVVEQLV